MRVLENAEKDLVKCLSEKSLLRSESKYNSTFNDEEVTKMKEQIRILNATQKTLYTTIARLRDQIASYSEYDRQQAEKQYKIVDKHNSTSSNVTNSSA